MGEAEGCNNLGYSYRFGFGELDDKKANEFFGKAYEMGDAKGCYRLGNLYREGEGVRQNDNKAMEFFGKACDLGEQKGCDAYKKMKLNKN